MPSKVAKKPSTNNTKSNQSKKAEPAAPAEETVQVSKSVDFKGKDAELKNALYARLKDEGPRTTAELTRGARVSRNKTFNALKGIEKEGLIKTERLGATRIWEPKED